MGSVGWDGVARVSTLLPSGSPSADLGRLVQIVASACTLRLFSSCPWALSLQIFRVLIIKTTSSLIFQLPTSQSHVADQTPTEGSSTS